MLVRDVLTGVVVRAEATRLLQEGNDQVPEASRFEFKFSRGLLWQFQQKWNLKSRKLHDEAGDADEQAVERDLHKLRAACNLFAEEDVGNANEISLNYDMPPDRTISQTAFQGQKKDKERLTLLFRSNASGTEKFPLLDIGNAEKPRCSKMRSGTELEFDHASNKKDLDDYDHRF